MNGTGAKLVVSRIITDNVVQSQVCIFLGPGLCFVNKSTGVHYKNRTVSKVQILVLNI